MSSGREKNSIEVTIVGIKIFMYRHSSYKLQVLKDAYVDGLTIPAGTTFEISCMEEENNVSKTTSNESKYDDIRQL